MYSLTAYENLPLSQLADKLNINFYAIIEALCLNARNQLANLKMLDIHKVTAPYTKLCEELLNKISAHLEYRRNALLAYINDLGNKADSSHDCSTCSGRCDMEHASHVMQLKESHQDVFNAIYRLKAIEMPLYVNAPYNSVYRILCNEMMLIDEMIAELFYLEEQGLIPGILESQKKINAGS